MMKKNNRFYFAIVLATVMSMAVVSCSNDEGLSEGVGNSLFNLLCGNRKANKMFSNARKDFTLQEGNDNMRRLMALMSIDIALAEYEDYEEFLDDFPMFQGCSEAEDEFNWIKENGI